MRGVTIAFGLLCLAVFSTFMAASGLNAVLGVSMHTNIADDAQRIDDNINSDQELSDSPGDGLFGIAVFAAQQLGTFFLMFGAVSSLLSGWGLPPSLASGIQILVSTTGTLALIWTARGLIGE